MIVFDKRGNLKPYEPIRTTIAEMKKYFGNVADSSTRPENFEKYLRYSNALKEVLGQEFIRQWINGSFATKKLNPKDIDLVTFVEHKRIKKLGSKLAEFQSPNSWEYYGVDAYIVEVYPDSNKNVIYTTSDIAYWRDQFTSTRPNRGGVKNGKGFLEIIY